MEMDKILHGNCQTTPNQSIFKLMVIYGRWRLGEFPINPKCTKFIKNKGKKYNRNNYRPIAIVYIFSKVLENMCNPKCTKFIEKTWTIYCSLICFWKKRSIVHALVEKFNYLAANLNSQIQVYHVLLDVKKYFDTLILT